MSETPESLQQPQQVDPQQKRQEERQQRSRQRSVVFYIAILFSAAFLLLAMSFMMERRQNAEDMDDLNQSLSGLKDSVSAMQSVQQLYEENARLMEQINALEESLDDQMEERADMAEEITVLKQRAANLEKQSQAMDWFWQIDEAFVLGRYTKARDLIAQLDEAGLRVFLPQQSITDNGRFSPRDRLEEICDHLN